MATNGGNVRKAGGWIGRWLALWTAVVLLSPVTAWAREDQVSARGFEADKVFNLGDIDSVSLFNGNLVVTLPLGSYPVNGDFSYGYSAVYNALVWDIEERYDTTLEQWFTSPVVSTIWNAGLGWMVTPGRLFEPNSGPENPLIPSANPPSRWLFIDSSGARHWFRSVLHTGIGDGSSLFSTDSTYLRMRTLSGTVREIDFPDGRVLRFTDEAAGAAQDWRVTQMRDAFGNTVNVSRTAMAGGEIWETYTDPHGRVQRLKFEPDPVGDLRLREVDLEAFGGTRATYTLSYALIQVQRCYRNTDPLVPNTSTVWVSVLTEVARPDGTSFEMLEGAQPGYSTSCGALGDGLPGAIQSVRLPTQGEIQWDYSNFYIPYVLAPSVPGSGNKAEFDAGASGVSERRELDANGTVRGTWRYTNEAVLVTNGAGTLLLDGETRTYVEYPSGDCTKHYFRASPGPNDYGLPISTLLGADAAGTFVSTETWSAVSNTPTGDPPFVASFSCGGTKLRSGRAKWAFEGVGVNRRVEKSRTIYHDDSDRFAETAMSGFDGLGNYRTATTDGDFGAGDVRTAFTNYNPGAGTFPGSFVIPPAAGPWVLGTFTERTVTEGSFMHRETFCFDAATGFLERQRTLKTGSEGVADLIAHYQDTDPGTATSSGNVEREMYYGGDLQNVSASTNLCGLSLPSAPVYELDHDYTSGTRSTSRYIDTSGVFHRFLLQTIDNSTGLVATSRDVSDILTTFDYDALGRLTKEQPQLGHGGRTEITYQNAGPGTKAQVFVVQKPNTGGGVLAENRIVFDDLGRVLQERRITADGSLNVRHTAYDGRGRKLRVSETDTLGVAPSWTTFTYDAFGRPTRIRPPDSSAHDVILAYKGVREVKRTVKVGTTPSGSTGVIETSSVTTEFYDRQGRLWRVIEPSGSGGANVTTTYLYNTRDQLRVVSTAAEGVTQLRRFGYDDRGFLVWEEHPEKGNAAGRVTYSRYDARGNLGRKQDGANDVQFLYDAAERLTLAREFSGAQRNLKEFVYATANTGTNLRKGKLWRATRHNYLPAFSGLNVEMKEVYAYQGVGGRVSSRITLRDGVSWFNQSFVWNDLGDLASVSYPSCLLAECESPPGTPIEPSRTVSYNYANGYLTSVPGFANTISYHPNEMVAQVTHTNGVSDIHDVDPDAMRRPRRIRFAGGGTNHYISGTYLYDGAGNITRTGNDRYLHDKVSRLVSGTVKQFGNTTQSYAYDTYGSLQSITTDGVVRATPTSPSTNRLTGATYDASGNVIQEGTSSYGYDAFNLMVDSTIGGSRRAYVYTADDERIAVATTVPLVGTWKVRDLDGQVLREFREAPSPGANFSWTRDYVRRDGQLLAKVEPTPVDTQHMHLDHLGSVRMVTDGSGSVVSTHHYYPFGEEATASGTEPMKFTGHERDLYGGGSLDLDYMHARYCSPKLGRFFSPDPIESGKPMVPQTWNKYTYGRNNPLKWVDPDGRESRTAQMVELAIHDKLQGEETFLDDPVLQQVAVVAGSVLSPLPGDEVGVALALGPRLVKPLVAGARAARATIRFRRLVRGFSTIKTRVTRAGGRGVRITRKDGRVIDITEARVKEFARESRAKKGLKPVKFDNALPGTKGKKRAPTEEELELLRRLTKGRPK